ncbi:MAG: ATP-binding protein [bacterium]
MSNSRENLSKTILLEIPPEVAGRGRRARMPAQRTPSASAAGRAGSPHLPATVIENAELKVLFNNLYDAALITNLSGHIVDANPRASHACQYLVPELCEMNISRIILGFDDAVMKMVCDNLTNDQFTLIQASCLRKDGREFPGEISTSRIHLTAGDYLCFFIRDVTARREAEEQIQRAHDELAVEVKERTKLNEELNAEIAVRTGVEGQLRKAIVKPQEHDLAKSQFVSNVSHELKTPLTSINYVAGNLQKGIAGPMGPQAQDYLAMIRADCERLARTVEDILDMSRIEAHALQLRLVKIHFPRFVRRAVESLRIQVETAGLTLKVSVGEGPLFVTGDPQKLERVIFNIIRNAIKYNTPQGFVEVLLRTDPESPEFVLVEVVDSGIGIEPQNLKRVTERFFRVGEHVSGAGLGLAICKELIEQHGGSIEIQSPAPDMTRGTLVLLRVPLIPPPLAMVVSDNEESGKMVREQMVASGYQTTDPVMLADFEPQATRLSPDLVVLDWSTTSLDAGVVVWTLRSSELFRHTPAIIISGGGESPVKAEILRGVGIPILTAPWQLDDLFKRLEQAVWGDKRIGREERK